MQATLHIPSFTRGCSQLSPMDVEATRKLANVRIHIERVIGASVETGSGHPGHPGHIFSGSDPVYNLSGSDPDWIT